MFHPFWRPNKQTTCSNIKHVLIKFHARSLRILLISIQFGLETLFTTLLNDQKLIYCSLFSFPLISFHAPLIPIHAIPLQLLSFPFPSFHLRWKFLQTRKQQDFFYRPAYWTKYSNLYSHNSTLLAQLKTFKTIAVVKKKFQWSFNAKFKLRQNRPPEGYT